MNGKVKHSKFRTIKCNSCHEGKAPGTESATGKPDFSGGPRENLSIESTFRWQPKKCTSQADEKRVIGEKKVY